MMSMTALKRSLMKRMDKVLSLLGLAARGRNLVSGEFSTEKAIKEGKASLVIVGADASNNTRKMFTNMCNYREIPIYFYSDKEALGRAIGKQMRASVAVTHQGMAENIRKNLEALK